VSRSSVLVRVGGTVMERGIDIVHKSLVDNVLGVAVNPFHRWAGEFTLRQDFGVFFFRNANRRDACIG